MEFVIVDDGCTDGTSEFLTSLTDPRVRLVRHATNKGLVASLNDGLAECRGSLIARLDADDACLPGRLRAQVGVFVGHPATALVSCAYERMTEDGTLIRLASPPQSWSHMLGRQLSGNRVCHSTAMFRADAARAAGGYRHEWFPVEDLDLWFRLTVEPFSALPTPLVQWSVSSTGISSTRSQEQGERHDERCRAEIAHLASRECPPVDRTKSRPALDDVRLVRRISAARRALERRVRARGESTVDLTPACRYSVLSLLAGRPRWWRQVVVSVFAPRIQFVGLRRGVSGRQY